MNETELVNRLKVRDESAFRYLIQTYNGKLINLCFKFLHNISDAEDASQDVFIEIYNSINKFNNMSSINTWIYRITVNKCIDMLRARKRKQLLTDFVGIFSEEYKKNMLNRVDYQAFFPDIEIKESIAKIFKAIDKLPENQKIAITLCKLDGLSKKEAAKVIGVSVGAVESLLQRGKKNLKYYLSKA